MGRRRGGSQGEGRRWIRISGLTESNLDIIITGRDVLAGTLLLEESLALEGDPVERTQKPIHGRAQVGGLIYNGGAGGRAQKKYADTRSK